jgi:hypothetical protein
VGAADGAQRRLNCGGHGPLRLLALGQLPRNLERRRDSVCRDATLPTARPWQIVSTLVPFPVGVAGLGIVDVGAGGSDAVAALLTRGANAYAVDPRYRSLPGLVRDVQAYLARQAAIGQLPQAREASAAGIAAQRAAFRRCVAGR